MFLELMFNAGLMMFFAYAYFFIGATVPPTAGPGWGAEVWPQAILLVLILLLGVNMYQVYRREKNVSAVKVTPPKFSLVALIQSKLVLSMAALLAYSLSLQTGGFILSTTVFFAVYARIVGQKNLRILAISSLVATFAVYFVFSRALGVMLPRGIGVLRDFALFLESL